MPSRDRRSASISTRRERGGARQALCAARHRRGRAPAMMDEARRKTPPELEPRVRFQVADASRLPFADGEFDLVAMNNMIPFFDELTRVLTAGGRVVLAFSAGAQTPIYVEPERLRRELARRGFAEFADFSVGGGTALTAKLH